MKRKQENQTYKEREIIMSLCETKGKEIGVCWIENNTNTISFCQYLDTNTYIQTLILINMDINCEYFKSKPHLHYFQLRFLRYNMNE